MECGQEFVSERNSILHLFDSLLIARYEIVRTKADWGDRREMDVFRLVARKPYDMPVMVFFGVTVSSREGSPQETRSTPRVRLRSPL